MLGEEDLVSVGGTGDIKWLFDVAEDCGDNVLDRGNSFSLREWPMPLGIPHIITVRLIVQCSGAISDCEVCQLLVLNMQQYQKHQATGALPAFM